MKEFVLGSGNLHKTKEFEELFDKNILQIKAAPSKLDVIESGTTYLQNALIKAEAYYQQFKVPVMSDDSGLNVSALPDDLGIYSARFGGPELSDKERAMLLLEKMKDVPDNERDAYFTCVLCFYLAPNEIYFFEGRMVGSIAYNYCGEHGFGYDPVFVPKELGAHKTVAEVPEWKKLNCHRAHACLHAIKFFKGL